MINSFSPLIQFIAAIYLSMCFDELLRKIFWVKSYSSKLTILISEIQNQFSGKSVDRYLLLINENTEKFEKKTKKMALFMLVYSLFLLFVGSLEQIAVISIGLYSLQLLNFSILLLGVYTFFTKNKYVLSSWTRTIKALLSLIILYIILSIYEDALFPIVNLDSNCVLWKLLQISAYGSIFITLSPLIFLLFRSWLATEVFIFYVKIKLIAENKLYYDTLDVLLDSEKGFKDIDLKYQGVVYNALIKSENNVDYISKAGVIEAIRNNYSDILYDTLSTSIEEVSFFKLIKALNPFHQNRNSFKMTIF